MKTYIIMYHSGKVEVITNENPQSALDYLADNNEYIDTIYQGDLVSFPQAKEQEEGKKPYIQKKMIRKPYQKEQSCVFEVVLGDEALNNPHVIGDDVLNNPYFDTKEEAEAYIAMIQKGGE